MTRVVTSKRVLLAVLLAVVVALVVPVAMAQETTAGLQGTVHDQSGAVVGNATVEVSSPALIGTKKVVTDSAGLYKFANLPPGEYTISVTAPGFRSYKHSNIDLTTGRLPILDISLQVGTATETVEVSSEAPIVDVTQSK